MPTIIAPQTNNRYYFPSLVSASFTRPNDTTSYTAGDVVSNSTSATTLMEFADSGRFLSGAGDIVRAELVSSKVTDVNAYRLWLWTISNPTVAADNAQYTWLLAELSSFIGYIDFPTLAVPSVGTTNAGAMGIVSDFRLPFVLAAGASSMYGFLTHVSGAIAPSALQTFSVRLSLDQM